jgi:hypothetical protein
MIRFAGTNGWVLGLATFITDQLSKLRFQASRSVPDLIRTKVVPDPDAFGFHFQMPESRFDFAELVKSDV